MRNWPNVVALRRLATRLNLATMKQTLKDLNAQLFGGRVEVPQALTQQARPRGVVATARR
jgi:hypothetical protein